MGRSKRPKDVQTSIGSSTETPITMEDLYNTRGDWRRQKRTSKRIYKRSPPTDYSWLHGTLFVVLLVIVVAWALGY